MQNAMRRGAEGKSLGPDMSKQGGGELLSLLWHEETWFLCLLSWHFGWLVLVVSTYSGFNRSLHFTRVASILTLPFVPELGPLLGVLCVCAFGTAADELEAGGGRSGGVNPSNAIADGSVGLLGNLFGGFGPNLPISPEPILGLSCAIYWGPEFSWLHSQQ